jgi:hypothetical protein
MCGLLLGRLAALVDLAGLVEGGSAALGLVAVAGGRGRSCRWVVVACIRLGVVGLGPFEGYWGRGLVVGSIVVVG